MPFQKGESGNPEGRPKGAKSKLSESFYEDCLALYQEEGIDGLRAFVNKNLHNKTVFYNWLAHWAEKQIKQETEHSGEVNLKVEKVITDTRPDE